jgi:hypothetical protein
MAQDTQTLNGRQTVAFKYRERAAETVNRRAEQSGNDFDSFVREELPLFDCKPGENCVRFMPPTWDDPDHYGIDIWVHYRIGPEKGSTICPYKMLNNKCPLCEEQLRCERAGDEIGARELKPTHRVLCWIINKKENKGPELWAMPWTLDRDIAKVCKDRETGETFIIDHPTRGIDVYFDKVGEKMSTKYNGVALAKRQSKLEQRDLDFIEENPLPETMIERSYTEIQEMFEGAASGAASGGDDRSSDRRGGSDRPATTSGRQRLDEDTRGSDRPASSDRGRDRDEPPPASERDYGRSDDRSERRDTDRRGDDRSSDRPAPSDDRRDADRRDERERPADTDRRPPPETERRSEPEPEKVTGSSRAQALKDRFSNRGRQ